MPERTCRGCRGIINTKTQTHYKKSIGLRKSYYCVSCLRFKTSEKLKESVRKEYKRHEMWGARNYEPSEKHIDELIAIQYDLVEVN